MNIKEGDKVLVSRHGQVFHARILFIKETFFGTRYYADWTARYEGEMHSQSKLTEKDVLCIRKSSLKAKQLSEMFGVTISTIGDIRMRRSWKHI